MRLGERTWTDIAGAPHLLLVPLGSTEQHGPHLPLDTDTRIAVAVAERLAADRPTTVVAPAVAITASGEHAGFAGTLSIGTETLVDVLVELARSADAFAAVVWVNAHGGNRAALDSAMARLATEGRATWELRCSFPGGDAHAGRTETSVMLALAPDLVRLDRSEPGVTEPWSELAAAILAGGIAAVSPNGILGDPTGASAAEGRDLLDGLVERLGAQLDRHVWSNSAR